MIFALINKSKVTEIAVADSVDMLPAGQWVEAHANVYVGCPYVDGTFVDVVPSEPVPEPDPAPEPPMEPQAPRISPVEFKLLFTAQERVAVNEAKATDPLIADFYSIVDDPRLTYVDLGLQSTKDAIDYMILKGLVNTERKEAILSGDFQ